MKQSPRSVELPSGARLPPGTFIMLPIVDHDVTVILRRGPHEDSIYFTVSAGTRGVFGTRAEDGFWGAVGSFQEITEQIYEQIYERIDATAKEVIQGLKKKVKL